MKQCQNDPTEQPFVSVIMPVRNESLFISRSIGAILEQNYPAKLMEIVIADGHSTDDTLTIIRKIARHSKIPFKIVNNFKGSAPTGLNSAIKEAAGEVVVRVDGHTIVDADYVAECVSALARSGASCVGGRMNAVSAKPIGKAISLATSSRFGIGNGRFHYSDNEQFVDTVYLGAWWRCTFDKHGLFDAELIRNQDDEFNYRLRSRGGKILLSPRIRSMYFNRCSTRDLWRQYFQYGYWKVRVLQLHPRQMSLRQFVPAAFVGSICLFAIIALFSRVGQVALAAELISYITANLFAAIYAARSRPVLIPALSLSFLILHLSYGLGFLGGLVAFRSRWRDRSGVSGQAFYEIEPSDRAV